jgi:RNA polymerase sigma factor (sigma-70 family)
MAGARMGGALRQIQHLFVDGTVAGLADEQLLEAFLADGDESAFTALVERHGPMVLSTCRSILHQPEDIEDAFQATFLILVCKGRSIRGRGALAIWLRQVAHRVAVRAGVEEARRRAHERCAGAGRAADPRCNDPDGDWRLILREELARLSDRYRLPLLLCDLEGKTHAEAAAELGCGPATVQRRLTTARNLLRSRLTRRGVSPTDRALATTLACPAAAQVPPAWVEATVRAATLLGSRAVHIAVGHVVSATTAELVRKSLRTMLLGQLKVAAVLTVLVAALGGIAWGVRAASPDEPVTVRPNPDPPRPRPMMPAGPTAPVESKPTVAGRDAAVPKGFAFHGRVVDPAGRPVAGATLYVAGGWLKPSAYHTPRATSGADGRFRFEVSRADFMPTPPGETPSDDVTVVARAPGYAFGLAGTSDPLRGSTLRLASDDAPIAGRVVDLEGRPVAGASVKVMEVRLPADTSSQERWVGAFKVLNAARPATNPYTHLFKDAVGAELGSMQKDLDDQKEWRTLDSPFLPNHADSGPLPAFIPDTTTDPDGRFRLNGIGRWRIATLQLEGPTIETTRFQVRSWPGAPIHVPVSNNPRSGDPLTVYGATFEHVAGPTRSIEGVVRDRESGQPLAGIIVYAQRPRRPRVSIVRTMTDAGGRYRLVGLPLGREGELVALPAGDFRDNNIPFRWVHPPAAGECPPYCPAEVPVGNRPGKEPVHVDIALKRGIRVTGRIIDKETRKPVRGRVGYIAFDDNPHYQADPHLTRQANLHFTDTDGIFRLVAYPGPAVLAAYVYDVPYIRAAGVEAIKDRRPDWLAHVGGRIRIPEQFHALQWIEPMPGVTSVVQDLVVEPGDRHP